MDDLLDEIITARVEAQRARGGEVSEEDIVRIRAEVSELLKDDKTAKMSQAIASGEVAEEFQRMNFTIGLPGAMALFEGLMRGAGLSNNRVKLHLRNIKLPPGCKADMRGGLTIAFSREGVPKEFHLHGGKCGAGHDFGAEIGKVAPYLEAKDLERVQSQCAHVVLFTRQAYVTLAQLNPEVAEEAAKGLGEGVKISEGIDVANSTIYLQKTGAGDPGDAGDAGAPVPFEPRAGLFFTEK